MEVRPMTITRRLPLALLLLATFPAMATAGGKVMVANDGLDGPGCGSRAAPCRSINQAIAHAAEGATIVVGPGRYGPGEEQPQLSDCADCLIAVTKRVTIASRDGAGATTIDVAGAHLEGVAMRADGARFGRKGKGFTVTGAGIAIAMRADGLRVEGNWIVHNDTVVQGSAIDGEGDRNAIVGNVVSDNGTVGIGLFGGVANTVAGNRVSGHWGDGILARESSGKLSGNAVSSAPTGVRLLGDLDLVGNAVVACDAGLILDHGVARAARYQVARNTITGSLSQGVGVQEGEPSLTAAVLKNNLFGNGLHLTTNCGLAVEQDVAPGAVTVAKNFWGVAGGPAAAEPADDACYNVVVPGPFGRKERPTRLKSAQ
jgi:parallel beta-helix repeat protein